MHSKSNFDYDGQRKLAEAHLRAVNFNTSRESGLHFYRRLVQDLAISLHMKYVLLGKLVIKNGREEIHTLAVWNGSGWQSNIEYSLKYTPCSNVIDQEPCFHPNNVQQEYPSDELLVTLDAESYIGSPLIDTSGQSLGILIALDTKSMDEHKRYLALSLLTVFASRCAAELQHRNFEAELERRVSARTLELESTNLGLRKDAEKFKYVAYHDSLTGLANRAMFHEHLNRALLLSRRNNFKVTIMMIDLDEFKLVNDKFGHAIGDIVLTTVAQRLKNILRTSDLTARLGGDEFVVLLDGVTGQQDIAKLAQSIINIICDPIAIDKSNQVEIGCTIGIASDTKGNLDLESLLNFADSAMYKAKHLGKSTWYIHEYDNTENPNAETYNSELDMLDEVRIAYKQFEEYEQAQSNSDKMLNLNALAATALGNDFFDILVKNLSEVLDVKYVFAGKLESSEKNNTIQIISMWSYDQLYPNLNFSLINSPCADVIYDRMCYHSSNIKRLYPMDSLLKKFEVESFIGIPMIDIEGKSVGVLVAMDKETIDKKKCSDALPLMTMFATRCAVELQHASKQNKIELDLNKKTQELSFAQELLKKFSN